MKINVYEKALKSQIRCYNSMYERISRRYLNSIMRNENLDKRRHILAGMERLESLIESCNRELYLMTA